MTTQEPGQRGHGPTINVVKRRDVEDYASGRLQDEDTAEGVEEVLLDDDAARDVLRKKLRAASDNPDGVKTEGLLFEPLQDLQTTAKSCTALADMYEGLGTHADSESVLQFLDRRQSAFRKAASKLAEPLRDPPTDIPATSAGEMETLTPESHERLVRQLGEKPLVALKILRDMHRPLMQGFRTLIHLPWPLATKLLIADAYALLREELESGAWHLQRGR